jgi:hypothetical protein
MYSSTLHIFYILLQCNMEIMSLNHSLIYVVETIKITMCSFILISFNHLEYIFLNPFTSKNKITKFVIFFTFQNIFINLRANIYFKSIFNDLTIWNIYF